MNQPVETEPQSVVQETAATQEASSVPDDTDDFLNRLTGVQTQVEPIEEIETPAVEPALEKPIEEQPVAEETAPDASSFLDQFLQSTDDTTIPEEPKIPEIASAPAAIALPPDGDIQQLLNATQNKPDDYISWQKLGDAYAGTGRYTDALFAYSKAEHILVNLI